MYLTYVVNAMPDQVYDISSGRFDHKRGLDAEEDSVSVFICQRNLVLYTVSLPSATVLLRIFIYYLDMLYSRVVIVFGKTLNICNFTSFIIVLIFQFCYYRLCSNLVFTGFHFNFTPKVFRSIFCHRNSKFESPWELWNFFFLCGFCGLQLNFIFWVILDFYCTFILSL